MLHNFRTVSRTTSSQHQVSGINCIFPVNLLVFVLCSTGSFAPCSEPWSPSAERPVYRMAAVWAMLNSSLEQASTHAPMAYAEVQKLVAGQKQAFPWNLGRLLCGSIFRHSATIELLIIWKVESWFCTNFESKNFRIFPPPPICKKGMLHLYVHICAQIPGPDLGL